jgi:hypothetical protein
MAYASSDPARRLPRNAASRSRTVDKECAPRPVLDWSGTKHVARPATIPDWSGRGFKPGSNPSLSWRGDAGVARADPSLKLATHVPEVSAQVRAAMR